MQFYFKIAQSCCLWLVFKAFFHFKNWLHCFALFLLCYFIQVLLSGVSSARKGMTRLVFSAECLKLKEVYIVLTKILARNKNLTLLVLVQSLNSPFFPPHIGAETGRAKEESRITCMCMLRTPPFFPPKSGEKPYLEVLSRFRLWRDYASSNNFRLVKNMSINWSQIRGILPVPR